MRSAYETMFINAGVSIVVSGHVHSFEYSCPVHNLACVEPGQGMVHFNCGDGGAGLYTKWVTKQPAWSMQRLAQWGHGEIQFVNDTTAHFRWKRNVDTEDHTYTSVYVQNVGL